MARTKANLAKAKAKGDDEFYTRFEDINAELQNYRQHFNNKIVYCNCDDGQWSKFWRFFYSNFEFFGLRKLIATSYHKDDKAFKYEYEGGYDKSDYVKNDYMEGVVRTELQGDGDFRSEECIELLKQADIIVTNPPFSLFREFIPLFYKYNKKFLVIGNKNAITYNDLFPLIKNNLMWLGVTTPSGYDQPEGATPKNLAGLTRWFTNLEHNKRHHIEEYYLEYSKDNYERYDNYDAIECGKSKDIPCDWTGEIGVPITFIDSYCPDQFDIVGLFKSFQEKDTEKGLICGDMCEYIHETGMKQWNGPTIDKVAKYARILIKWKPEAMPTINDGVILYGKQKSDRSESGKE